MSQFNQPVYLLGVADCSARNQPVNKASIGGVKNRYLLFWRQILLEYCRKLRQERTDTYSVV